MSDRLIDEQTYKIKLVCNDKIAYFGWSGKMLTKEEALHMLMQKHIEWERIKQEEGTMYLGELLDLYNKLESIPSDMWPKTLKLNEESIIEYESTQIQVSLVQPFMLKETL